jgi:Fur family ferric uptake transcriptional regulator
MSVLELLARAQAPLSHAELSEALDELGFDRATVYRNLVDLARAGLVVRADRGDHVWRFELVREGGASHGRSHPHLVCVDCGDNVCLPDVKVTVTAGRRRRRVSAMEVQLRGRCDACEGAA